MIIDTEIDTKIDFIISNIIMTNMFRKLWVAKELPQLYDSLLLKLTANIRFNDTLGNGFLLEWESRQECLFLTLFLIYCGFLAME